MRRIRNPVGRPALVEPQRGPHGQKSLLPSAGAMVFRYAFPAVQFSIDMPTVVRATALSPKLQRADVLICIKPRIAP